MMIKDLFTRYLFVILFLLFGFSKAFTQNIAFRDSVNHYFKTREKLSTIKDNNDSLIRVYAFARKSKE
jgi:hypothetical protein